MHRWFIIYGANDLFCVEWDL